MTQNNTRAGILLMVAAMAVFAGQDGISRYLAENYNVMMVVMVRYWFFAAFVISVSRIRTGSLTAAAKTEQPWLQAFRGVLLAAEILVTILSFVLLGLIQAHAIFAMYPLLVAALSGPVLGEKVGWRRWTAVGIGFVGMLVILKPGFGVFSPYALIAVVGALMFALYNLLNRYAARKDSSATSFFWTGVAGCVVMTVTGIFFWEPMAPGDWVWMGILCVTGATGHFLLIKVYEMAEASAVQPFAYLQLVFVTGIGLLIFDEELPLTTLIGVVIVVSAGLFTLWREKQVDVETVEDPAKP